MISWKVSLLLLFAGSNCDFVTSVPPIVSLSRSANLCSSANPAAVKDCFGETKTNREVHFSSTPGNLLLTFHFSLATQHNQMRKQKKQNKKTWKTKRKHNPQNLAIQNQKREQWNKTQNKYFFILQRNYASE